MNPQNSPAARRSPGTSALLRIVVVTAILLAAGLATLPFEHEAPSPPVGDRLAAPALSMFAAPAAGTSVPAASEVFTGREVATEQAAPTF